MQCFVQFMVHLGSSKIWGDKFLFIIICLVGANKMSVCVPLGKPQDIPVAIGLPTHTPTYITLQEFFFFVLQVTFTCHNSLSYHPPLQNVPLVHNPYLNDFGLIYGNYIQQWWCCCCWIVRGLHVCPITWKKFGYSMENISPLEKKLSKTKKKKRFNSIKFSVCKLFLESIFLPSNWICKFYLFVTFDLLCSHTKKIRFFRVERKLENLLPKNWEDTVF